MSDAALWPTGVEVTWLDDIDDGQRNMDLDVLLGEQVGRGERPPMVRIWRGPVKTGIGLSKKDVATDAGRAAQAALQAEGCTVVVRQTGGTAVPQGPGVVQVSYLFRRPATPATTDAFYRLLCDPLMQWLRSLGLAAETGELPGSYCDGRYNVLVGGKKLIGTAQAWRGGLAGMASSRPGYVLAHGCIAVDADMDWMVAQMNRFYELAGNPYRVDRATAVTLRDLLPGTLAGMDEQAAGTWAAQSLVSFFRTWRPSRENEGPGRG
ncbi:lipoate--protein ligase family protein [Alicyclobacillus macrosporangiidus]|uniref:Biotin/lipoate A/B protein ligase family protein n=1 Tax=Alicyclobacillus macrosporangiidus TaxID=392015 RepID=A0A1I7GX87_9BACL|nr:ligase [Alicyclobacillus macrosporangiidus]SFU53020.1 Biotin/lipoate A/B protein ligase family protein [Alicyclobacillus macrosporangiidus]